MNPFSLLSGQVTSRAPATRPRLARWRGAAVVAALLLAIFSTGAGPVTWQVQSDYFGIFFQARAIRGLALSREGSSVYHGCSQNPDPYFGTTALRKVKASVLAVPGTDHVIFGNGMPGAGWPFISVAAQPVYAGGGTGTFEAWRDVGNSPEAMEADDRGYVYVALSSGTDPANMVGIYNADLSAELGQIALTKPTGLAVFHQGSTYYLYTMSAAGLQRFDVTTAIPSTPDPAWSSPIYGGAGLAVDDDGTVFIAGADQVRRVLADGSAVIDATYLPGARDLAIFQDKIYVVTHSRAASSAMVVFKKNALASGGAALAVPDFGSRNPATAKFTSIDVSADGRLYLAEENYNSLPSYTPPPTSFKPEPGPINATVYFDRILISSPLPESEPPVVNCPPNQSAYAYWDCAGWIVPGTATAVDRLGQPVPTVGSRSDAQPLDALYPVGITTITWTAIDTFGNSNSCTQTLEVLDFQPPSVLCPPPMTVLTDQGDCEPLVTFVATAKDDCPVAVLCEPPSGSRFAQGTTTVTCSAIDASGHVSAPCAFTVTVQDDDAPQLSCPANITVTATSSSGAVVTYPPATVLDNCGPLTATCTPPSNSTFPPGATPVTCTALDVAGNSASCGFTVTVIGGARVMKQAELAYLQQLLPTIANAKQRSEVQDAINKLGSSLAASYWVDNFHLIESTGSRVFDLEKAAIADLRYAVTLGLANALVQRTIVALVAADRDLATTAISDAIAAHGDAGKIAAAQSSVAKGDSEAAANRPDRAIDAYKNAWKYAVAAY